MNDRHQCAKSSVLINASDSADNPWPEPRLAQGLIQGDADAREAFVMLSHDAVYAFACRRTQDFHLRQDWTHDVILRLLEDLKGGSFVYRRPGSFWAWFRKRAWFLVLEEGRRHRVRETRERPTPDEALPECPGPDSTADLTEDHEAAYAVERCLEALSNSDHAQALRLRMSDDTSYEGIAEALGVPLNTVRAWIRRGRVGLRQCLVQRFGWNLPEDES